MEKIIRLCKSLNVCERQGWDKDCFARMGLEEQKQRPRL